MILLIKINYLAVKNRFSFNAAFWILLRGGSRVKGSFAPVSPMFFFFFFLGLLGLLEGTLWTKIILSDLFSSETFFIVFMYKDTINFSRGRRNASTAG